MEYKLMLILATLMHLDNYHTQSQAFFRKDYHYLSGPQSFYKIHKDTKNWTDARRICRLEGASLFYPENESETQAVVQFWNKTELKSPFEWIHLGISSRFTQNAFVTIDGRSVMEIQINWAPWEPNNGTGYEDCVIFNKVTHYIYDDTCSAKRYFICKKTLASLEWNEKCALPDPGYVYNASLGKCYKSHLTPKKWRDAYSICYNEQSHLAIVDSEEEADHLLQLMAEASQKAKWHESTGSIHVGFQNIDQEGWTTIHGVPLEETGYNKTVPWLLENHMNGCGSMNKLGTLDVIRCDYRRYFICEHNTAVNFGDIFDNARE